MEPGRWYRVAAVKDGTSLSLFVNGELRGQVSVPLLISSQARDIALGGNPHFAGNEFLAARFARFSLYARALSVAELRDLR